MCTRCFERGSECTYPSLFVLYSPKKVDDQATKLPKISADATSFTTDQDAFLMNHCATTLLTTPAIPPILEPDIIPHLAAAFRTATHVELALSGLYIASYSSPSEGSNYLSAALAHKDAALQILRSTTTEGLTTTTAGPQLPALAMLVACCLALPAADPGRRLNLNRIDILAEVAGILRLINYIAHQAAFKDLPPPQKPRSPGDDARCSGTMNSLQRCVEALMSLPRTADPEEEQRRLVMGHAASELRTAVGNISDVRGDFHVIGMWLGTVHPEFVGFIQTRDPMALLLLAHWAVWWSAVDDNWWARGWPAMAVGAIYETLDDTHRPLLTWCLSETREVRGETSN